MTKFGDIGVSRRRFLGAELAAGALAMPSVVRAQEPVVLKMQTSWTAQQLFQQMARQYAERVQKMSGGRLRIDLLPAGAVVGAFQVQDAVQEGAIDAMHTVPSYWYGKHKAASLFGAGPVFGAASTEMLGWFYEGGGRDLYRELVQDILGLNIVGFFAFAMPPQPLGWFKQPVESADQLKAVKYRTVGLAADLFEAMGLTVAQLPGNEIVPAMQRGIIDAFEFNNPTDDMRFGAQDVAKTYMLGSYHQAYESFEIAFNKDVFDRLGPDLQAILEYSAEAASTVNHALALNQYSTDLVKLEKEQGVSTLRTPETILSAELEGWDKVIGELEKDEFSKRLLDSQRAWSERVAYYGLMNNPSARLAFDHYFPGRIPAG